MRQEWREHATKQNEQNLSKVNERLLRENLSKNGPLPPRRTLDQSYHWKPENTTRKDRDQVIYRATTLTPHLIVWRTFRMAILDPSTIWHQW